VIAYIDSSVLLRVVLAQPNSLKEWRQIERGVSSVLLRLECLRTVDRLRARVQLADSDVAETRSTLITLLDFIDLVELDRPILDRAAQPLPTELGTLDAIHLATALLWRETFSGDLVMATHDIALAIAARAQGFNIMGT
jgi:predicted nucleic acid-binding protein